MAQRVKNLPVVWETSVGSLGWKDSPRGGFGTPVFLPGESPCSEEPMEYQRVGHD